MADAANVIVIRELSAKDAVRALLDRLPDSVTLEDIAYHLDVVIKVLEAEADTSGDITREEMKRQICGMVRRASWRPGARADRAASKDYIARESPLAGAEKVVTAIEAGCRWACGLPLSLLQDPRIRRSRPPRNVRLQASSDVSRRAGLHPHPARGARSAPGQDVTGSFQGGPHTEYSVA
ncbi:MAG TPA: hypothetical protein VFZ16_12155 [Hyphomicrobiaceae bacterium]|nr:hypothetical protein [Hyphomicrobiaceae bacterium]